MLRLPSLPKWLSKVWDEITAERVTAAGVIVAAAGVIVAAAAFVLGYSQYSHQVDEERLKRALELIEKSNRDEPWPLEDEDKWKDVEARRALVRYFPDRYVGVPLPINTLSPKDAEELYKTAIKPNLAESDRTSYQRWDAARRHLNNLEIFAFAYVYDFADRKLLAASSCYAMVRSNAYFATLIDIFRQKFGPSQSWQIIPKAVHMMEDKFGKGCDQLYPAQGQAASRPVSGREK